MAAGYFAIRRYQRSDREVVWDLHNLALHQVGAHAGNGPWDEDLHRIEEVYLEDEGEFLVGVLEGRVVAMGALRKTDGTRAQITRMRVHPDFQRRGFGRAILRALESRARELGYQTLHLDTTIGQIGAQRLYESEGFREVGRSHTAGFDTILYEKEIERDAP